MAIIPCSHASRDTRASVSLKKMMGLNHHCAVWVQKCYHRWHARCCDNVCVCVCVWGGGGDIERSGYMTQQPAVRVRATLTTHAGKRRYTRGACPFPHVLTGYLRIKLCSRLPNGIAARSSRRRRRPTPSTPSVAPNGPWTLRHYTLSLSLSVALYLYLSLSPAIACDSFPCRFALTLCVLHR